MIKTIKIFGIIATVMFAACNEEGYEFMPDMVHSRAYEPYSTYGNYETDSMSARMPVKGTVPRGFMPYHIENTKEGYEQAGSEVTNPLPLNAKTLAEGQQLYTIYCAVCHGESGEGNGGIVQSGKFPPPPSYFSDQLKNLPEGKMYHTIMYGKNLMGSYASQLSPEERWKVIHYVKELQGRNTGGSVSAADTTLDIPQTLNTATNIDSTATNNQ